MLMHIFLLIMIMMMLTMILTMMLTRWTSRENLLAAAGDEDGDPQLFVSLYDFQVVITNHENYNDDDDIMIMTAIW